MSKNRKRKPVKVSRKEIKRRERANEARKQASQKYSEEGNIRKELGF